jgi:hypothetical protein
VDIGYPIPPAALPGPPSQAGPLGELAAALRMTRPAAPAPQFTGDRVIDPMSLRRRLRLRAGLATLTADDHWLTMRIRATRSRILWADIWGFEQRFTAPGGQTVPNGSLVALTTLGPVGLPATRGSRAEVRHAHAVLDAYRIRAQTIPGGWPTRGD